MAEFSKVAVIGCGTTGGGIAQVLAQAGKQVTIVGADQEGLDHGIAAVGDFLAVGVGKGKVSEDERAAVLDALRGTTELTDIADVDLVIEAFTEDRDSKRDLITTLNDIVGADAVVVTHTNALSITDVAGASVRPERFAGLHFFNPVPLTKAVEIVGTLQTSADVLDSLAAFVTELGKDPIPVKDRPGFLVGRLLMPYLNDVIQAYDDGLATAEDLDVAIRLGLGYKKGPLELLDRIGIDVHAHATRSAYDALLDPVFAPPPLLQSMVAAGHLGNKNGKGFRNLEENA